MKTTEKAVGRFLKGIDFSAAENEAELGYQDPFVTSQQKKRDKKITELLDEYVSFYKKKVHHSTICRYIILGPCMMIVLGFSIILAYIAIRTLKSTTTVPVTDLVAFVTACISFISLIIGLLTIITKYFFPENDEQYITTIVEAIQKNDLENKRENAKYEQNNSTPPLSKKDE
jgi:multidrug efflux pump subunit AcrB